MLAKEITFTDPFTEEEVKKTFYFNLTKAELVELERSKTGGLSDIITRIIAEKNYSKLIPYFKEIISMSYGVRTDNGSFIKSKEETEAFIASEAYSELFMSFYEADNLIQFIQGIIPKDLREEISKKYPDGLPDTEDVLEIIKMEKNNAIKNNSQTN